MSFTHADVQNIIKLLDASHFDEMVLELDGVKLELRRGGAQKQTEAAPAAKRAEPVAAAASAAPASAAGASRAAALQPTAAAPAPDAQGPSSAGLQEVRAPMLGTFYSSPKPGAAAFVKVGDRIEADTVVGIIEVMKLMNSTAAGVSGEIVEILVKDGELVEFDQPLMRVRA